MDKRNVVQVAASQKISLSLLQAQKDMLERLGRGNVSRGYRLVMRAFQEAIDAVQMTSDAYDAVAVSRRFMDIFGPIAERIDATD